MQLRTNTLKHIRSAVASVYPNEACGFIIVKDGKQLAYIARNDSHNKSSNFLISPDDYINAEFCGNIVAIWHSHPDGDLTPSTADKSSCEASKMPWLIFDNNGNYQTIEPSGFQADLIGRPYVYGIHDCYTIVRDYYEQLNIKLNNYQTEHGWWNKGKNLYLENFKKEGFEVVTDESLKKHDMILMQMNSNVPNHAGVYLSDGLMLHHPDGAVSLSRREVYGGYWAKHTTHILRHRELM